MRKESLANYHTEGASIPRDMATFEAHWRDMCKRQGCAWVKVYKILGLQQGAKGWKVRYRVGEASVTRPINPILALELVDENLIGHSLVATWFIVNPKRVAEVVTLA